MNAGRSVSATFSLAAAQHTLTVSTTGAGSGTVTGIGISCKPNCLHSYPTGTSVVLTATHLAGSTLGSWSGGGCSGNATTCTVTMSSDESVAATFTTIPTNTLTVSGSPSWSGGAVDIALTCAAAAQGGCQTTGTLTTTETVRGGKPVGVSANAAARKHRTVVVGLKMITIQPGRTVTLKITLNATGRMLLKRFGRVPVKLIVTVTTNGKHTTVATKQLTVRRKH
jgi:hypothetical protein